MRTTLPTGTNPLTPLNGFHVVERRFSAVLDFGRYTIRFDPENRCGWYKSELLVNRDEGEFSLPLREDVPPQVAIAVRRAGYA